MATRIWFSIAILITLVVTEPQFAYPGLIAVLPMPPIAAPPPVGIPIPVPVPVGVPIPVKETTTTCTTKTYEKEDMVWPFSNKNFTLTFPRYFALPPPSFPLPLPLPMPPPVIMVPIPPILVRKRRYGNKDHSELSSTDIESNTSTSDESESRRRSKRNKRRKRKYGIYRRHRRSISGRVKPVLTYISEKGDVKFRRYLTKSDEKLLMDENDSMDKVELVAGQDANGKSRIIVVAETVKPLVQKRMQIRTKTSQRTLGEGQSNMVFRPPADKKITNLSISFNMKK